MVRVNDILEVAEGLEKKKKKTTSKETWKLFERTVASDFGTTRTPLSGMVKTITNSDTLHPKIYVECKYRANDYGFWDEFEQKRLENPDKIVVVCLHPKGMPLVHLYHCTDFFRRVSNSSIQLSLICHTKYKGVNTLFTQTIERSDIEEKIPVIAIKKKQGRGYLIGIEPRKFVELQKILNKHGQNGGSNSTGWRRSRTGEE